MTWRTTLPRMPAFRRDAMSIGVLSANPPIVHIKFWQDASLTLNPLRPLLQRLKDRKVWILFSFGWCMEYPEKARKVKQLELDFRKEFPLHTWEFLAATECELEILQAAGLSAFWCHQNCFLDENLYRIIPETPKRFDAVYDARLSEFKRHDLAQDIQSLALITYVHRQEQTPEDRRYIQEIRQVLPQAYWFNNPFKLWYRRMSSQKVCAALNTCRVGLCLSAEEGGMYASTQYLLCGLPVVSTRSKGGRELFFNPSYTRIAEDTPQSVRGNVDDLCNLEIDPTLIRNAVLDVMQEHRSRLIQRIEHIRLEAGNTEAYQPEWDQRFSDKWTVYMPYRKLFEVFDV